MRLDLPALADGINGKSAAARAGIEAAQQAEEEAQRLAREQENTEIHDLVHAFHLTPEQLGQLLRQTAQSLPSPEAVNQVVKEDATDED